MGIRVLSYDVRSLRDDRKAVARVIEACRPDVVCLQEAPRLTGWRRARRELAREVGLGTVVNRRAGGLVVLARPWVRVRHTDHRLLGRHPGTRQRAVSVAVLWPYAARRPLAVASTHLDPSEAPRLEQAHDVLRHLLAVSEEHDAEPVLAGGMNCEPGDAAWAVLADALTDAGAACPLGEPLTFPARHPRRRIDGVLISPRLPLLGCGVPVDLVDADDLTAATDHRPVLLDIADW